METFFTSDHHFGHSGMFLKPFMPRFGMFESSEAMDEAMIAAWNTAVGRNDEVWHLGDFSMWKLDRTQEILSRLNGRKHLVLGNHDDRKIVRRLVGWESVQEYREVKVGERRFVLLHYPMRQWNRRHYGAMHLYGHSHGTVPPLGRSMDVGVDCWGLAPVHVEAVVARLADRPKFDAGEEAVGEDAPEPAHAPAPA